MKKITKAMTVAVMAVALSFGLWAAAQVLNPPLSGSLSGPLSRWMPAGALLYLESSDFGAQLRDWNGSQVKSMWSDSANHEEFLRTRLYLKLHDVYNDFAAAAGFEPGLDELETVAGTETALAVYDIGQLDLLYISRLPSARLGQNVLTRARSGYQTRSSGEQTYNVRTAGARLAAFAVVGDYVIVSNREDLLTGAIELMRVTNGTAVASIRQEAWYEDAFLAMATDPGARTDMRLVMDVARVVKTPYFRSYWIQRNTSDLRQYYAFLSQIDRTAAAINENRVLLRSRESGGGRHESAVADLQKYVPDRVGLSRLWDVESPELALELLRDKFLDGSVNTGSGRRSAPSLALDQAVGSESDLETRIDEAPKPSLSGDLDLQALRILIQSAGLEAILHLESSAAPAGDVFMTRDVAMALRSANDWNAVDIRSSLSSAVASYQTVAGYGLEWRDVTIGSTTFSQWNGLLPLTIYVSGRTLLVGKTPSLLLAAVQHAAATGNPATPGGIYAARYDHQSELPSYIRLMSALDFMDGRVADHSFFSGNVGALATTLDAIQSISVVVRDDGLVQKQNVTYTLRR